MDDEHVRLTTLLDSFLPEQNRRIRMRSIMKSVDRYADARMDYLNIVLVMSEDDETRDQHILDTA